MNFRVVPLPESVVKIPSDMIALGDSMSALTNRYMLDTALGVISRSGGHVQGNFNQAMIEDSIREQSRRHGGMANIAFCDAHVAGLKFQPLFFDESDDALRRWNNDHEPHREVLRGGR
jgi:prepilin-type processing-associated H-X9-DG protein